MSHSQSIANFTGHKMPAGGFEIRISFHFNRNKRMANYLSADLVAALSSLNVHDFPHCVEYELIKLLNTINFFCSARTTYFRGSLLKNTPNFVSRQLRRRANGLVMGHTSVYRWKVSQCDTPTHYLSIYYNYNWHYITKKTVNYLLHLPTHPEDQKSIRNLHFKSI